MTSSQEVTLVPGKAGLPNPVTTRIGPELRRIGPPSAVYRSNPLQDDAHWSNDFRLQCVRATLEYIELPIRKMVHTALVERWKEQMEKLKHEKVS